MTSVAFAQRDLSPNRASPMTTMFDLPSLAFLGRSVIARCPFNAASIHPKQIASPENKKLRGMEFADDESSGSTY